MINDFHNDPRVIKRHQQVNAKYIEQLFTGGNIKQPRYDELLKLNSHPKGIKELASQRILAGVGKQEFELSLKEHRPIIPKKNFLEMLSTIHSKEDLSLINEDILRNVIDNDQHYQRMVLELNEQDLLHYNLGFGAEVTVENLVESLNLILDSSLDLKSMPVFLEEKKVGIDTAIKRFFDQDLRYSAIELAYYLLKIKEEGLENTDTEILNEITKKSVLYEDLLENIRDGEEGQSAELFQREIEKSQIPISYQAKLLNMNIQELIDIMQKL